MSLLKSILLTKYKYPNVVSKLQDESHCIALKIDTIN